MMGSAFRRGDRPGFCSSACRILSLIWVLGLLLGGVAAYWASDAFFLLMRRAPGEPVSIVGLFTSAFLPFLFAAFAVYISKPWLLYTVCFAKAFLFSMGALGVSLTFGSAGWLVHGLLQFTDCWLLPFFCWFVLRHCAGGGKGLLRDLSVCACAALLCGSLDLLAVSPLLVSLVDI